MKIVFSHSIVLPKLRFHTFSLLLLLDFCTEFSHTNNLAAAVVLLGMREIKLEFESFGKKDNGDDGKTERERESEKDGRNMRVYKNVAHSI